MENDDQQRTIDTDGRFVVLVEKDAGCAASRADF